MTNNDTMAELFTFRAYDGNVYEIASGRGATPLKLQSILKYYAEFHNNPDLIRKYYFIEQLKEGWLKDTELLSVEKLSRRLW